MRPVLGPSIVGALATATLLIGVAPRGEAYPRPHGRTERVDVTSAGRAITDSHVQTTSISSTGRFVAFDSDSQLAAGDTNGATDVYLRDTETGTTRLVSRGLGAVPARGLQVFGTPGDIEFQRDNLSFDPSISGNGRYIAFTSTAMDLIPGDTNLAADVFVHDMRTGRTVRASVSSTKVQANGPSYLPSISGNGRYVSFTSEATDLVPHDTNGIADVFVHDLVSGGTTRVSVSSRGEQADGTCLPPPPLFCLAGPAPPESSISASGRYVAFDSEAPNLAPNDTNGITDVFLHDMKTRTTTLVSVSSDGALASDPPSKWIGNERGSWLSGGPADDVSPRHNVSANGRFVTFVSSAGNLVPNDTNRPTEPSALGGEDVFLRDLRTGRTYRVSVEPDGREAVHEGINQYGAQGAGHAREPSITPDGRYIVFSVDPFVSEADSAYPSRESVAIFDRVTGSVDAAPLPDGRENGSAWQTTSFGTRPDISSTGRFISSLASSSTQAPLAAGVFEWDRGSALGAGGFAARAITSVHSFSSAGTLTRAGPTSNTIASQGGDLLGARVVHRPRYRDLFVREELRSMPSVSGTPVAGNPSVLYGLDLRAGGVRYEVRVQHAGVARFGLFRLERGRWVQTATLRGGYGTTGDEVVFALPLRDIGAQRGGHLSHVRAFTALGSFDTGPVHVLDQARIG